MEINEIVENWEIDSKLEITKLSEESINVDSLHHKYYKLLLQEKQQYKILETKEKVKRKEKYYFYSEGSQSKTTAQEFIEKNGAKTILKADIEKWMDADRDLLDIDIKLFTQKTKIEYLESIIKQIQTRNFSIKNAIEYLKYTSGII